MLKIHLLAAMLLFDLSLIHIHDFPQVSVRILEAPSVHKAMIHRIIEGDPPAESAALTISSTCSRLSADSARITSVVFAAFDRSFLVNVLK